VDKVWPHLTLIWQYQGKDLKSRREAITALNYPSLEIIVPERSHTLEQLADLVSQETELCIFWSDDEKPIRPDFLHEMVQPLTVEGSARSAMHLWSGNAIAIPKSALMMVEEGNFQIFTNSFMKLALLFLDVGSASHGVRANIAYSTTERLAPLCADPVGRVS